MARVQPVPVETVRPLRAEIMRPGGAPADVIWPGDDDPGTLHVAAFAGDEVAAIGTVHAEPHPVEPREGDWRVRGMATAPEHRGRGLGTLVLGRCLDHVGAQGGTRVWCNARLRALALYERAGFEAETAPFDVAGIGAHVRMARKLP